MGHGRLSQKSFLWVITLHKIILVSDDASQNHSCGVVVPPQIRSCKEKKVNTKCKWECKSGKSFSSFSYELGEKQEQREQRKEEHEVGLVELGQRECHGLPVHRDK